MPKNYHQVAEKFIRITIMVVLILTASSSPAMTSEAQADNRETSMHTWTVAKVTDNPKNDFIKVVFLESAQIYRLMRNNKNFASCLAILRGAEKNKLQVKLQLTEPYGNIIEHVEEECKN